MVIPSNSAEPLTILGVFAHPDDEGFGSGGTLAMLVDKGHRVSLICATNGDVGEISDPALATPENLGQVRQQEMRDAMKVTGVKDVRFLGYRDSGMDGTPDNDNPNSLYQAPAATVVGQIDVVLAELEPDVIITHDHTGGYGHPDHITVYRHTSAAIEARYNGDGLHPTLYYVCFPRSNFQRMWKEMRDAGVKPPFGSEDAEVMGTPDDEVTTIKDVANYLETKKESLNHHRTQIATNGPFAKLPEKFINEIMSTEYYYLVQPNGGPKQRDILAEIG